MIAACYILHYGKEWLAWSMRSVYTCVDEIFVYYTHTPSHGHDTILTNPDTRDELYKIAKPFGAIWHDAQGYEHEGLHREAAVQGCKEAGANLVVVVDADEIWPQDVLETAIQSAYARNFHSYRIGMRHFWRSLKWVCDDGAMPTRLIRTDIDNSSEEYVSGKVFHMGYAQSPAVVSYKQSIHGHKAEWRPDWYLRKFLDWHPGVEDVHPTNSNNYWNPQPYSDDGQLKYLVGDHPYWGMEIIR